MGTLAAVPTGSMVDPCCCPPADCHAFYGDILEAVISAPIACDCIYIATGGGEQWAKLVIVDFPAAWEATWTGGEWDAPLAGSVEVWTSNTDCGTLVLCDTVQIRFTITCLDDANSASLLRVSASISSGCLLTGFTFLLFCDNVALDVFSADPTVCPGYLAGGGGVTISKP